MLGTLISHAWGIFSFWEEVRAGYAAVTARVSWWQVGAFAWVLGLGSPLSPRCTWHVFIVVSIPQSIYCQLQPGHRCEMLAVGLCGGLQGWQTLGGAGAPQRSLCCCSLPSVLEGHPNPLMYLVPAFCPLRQLSACCGLISLCRPSSLLLLQLRWTCLHYVSFGF